MNSGTGMVMGLGAGSVMLVSVWSGETGSAERAWASGTFSPALGKASAFARIPGGEAGDVRVDIRGREVPVRIVKFPFVRDGKPA